MRCRKYSFEDISPTKMNSPLRLPSSGASRHHPSTFTGLNTLQYLSRGLSHPGSWFPHRLESKDHALPCFCPKLSFLIQVVGFPIGLSPRTMQCLGSIQNLVLISSWGNYPLGYGVCPRFKRIGSSAKPLVLSTLLTLQSAAPSEEISEET